MREIQLTKELRPCYVVNDKINAKEKSLFHTWCYDEKNIPKGLVEFEDGRISLVSIDNIIFADRKIDEYSYIPIDK